LIAHLEKTILSEKIIEEDLSLVEKSATKSTYKLSVGFKMCEDKGVKSALKFISSSTYHKEEATIKHTKADYPSNPKPSFNPKREVRKETPKSREKVFICMFCGRVGYLDEFCFRRKRIERGHFDYARNSYRDVFSDFSPRALPQFARGPNHRSYGFDSRVNCFESRCFGYGPRPHHGDRFPRISIFPAVGSYTHLESRHLDGPRFPHHGSRPTQSSDEVQRTVKISFGHMVKCRIPNIYFTNRSTESSTFSHPM
jgi:hypothetical protein